MKLTVMAPKRHVSGIILMFLLSAFNRFHTFIWCSIHHQINVGSVDELLNGIFFCNRASTVTHLHTRISPPESFTDLQIRIKIIFTKSISGVVLKLVKMKTKDKRVPV